MAQSLIRILDDLAIHHPKLVLLQGRRYWRIEDLLAQAKRDLVRSQRDREALSHPAYEERDLNGKVVILKGRLPIFFEAGLDPDELPT